jgi:hypothetical protein
MPELDPRWDWAEVYVWGESQPRYIKGFCNHLEVVLVKDVDGLVVAHLCRTCDGQLPAEWTAARMLED